MNTRGVARIASSAAKNFALAAPGIRKVYERRLLARGYDSAKDSPEYPLAVFRRHADAVTTVRPIEGTILEVGPGGNVAVTVLFLLAGAADAICIDVVPWARDAQRSLYAEVVRRAAAEPDRYRVSRSLRESALRNPAKVADELVAKISYRAPESIEDFGAPSESFAISFSQACFEHLRHPDRAASELARTLQRGGVTSHQIDLRDHLDFDRSLEFLQYPERLWWLATSRLNSKTNRWRASDWCAAFEKNGLKVVEMTQDHTIRVTESERRTFSRRFRGKTLADLAVGSALFVAVKPA